MLRKDTRTSCTSIAPALRSARLRPPTLSPPFHYSLPCSPPRSVLLSSLFFAPFQLHLYSVCRPFNPSDAPATPSIARPPTRRSYSVRRTLAPVVLLLRPPTLSPTLNLTLASSSSLPTFSWSLFSLHTQILANFQSSGSHSSTNCLTLFGTQQIHKLLVCGHVAAVKFIIIWCPTLRPLDLHPLVHVTSMSL